MLCTINISRSFNPVSCQLAFQSMEFKQSAYQLVIFALVVPRLVIDGVIDPDDFLHILFDYHLIIPRKLEIQMDGLPSTG